MRSLALVVAASLIGTAALAQSSTTVTRTDSPLGSSTTVTRESAPVVEKRTTVESTGSVTGCDTKSVTKTNEFGDTKTKTKTEC